METQTASRVTMDAATSQESVAAFVEETLAGSGWQLHRVRRRGTRLEPPDWYWTTFALDINKDGEERSLRLVAKGALNPAAWEKLKARLSDASTHPCEPIGLLLEEGVRGRPVSSKRTSSEFALMSGAAAEALAVIHESGVENDERIEIEREIARLDRVVEQFAYVLPQGHFLLKDLVTHMRERVRRTTEEEWLPTHGDLKYDQFVFHNDQYTLLDFDYFATAETSYDLGKFCAYLVPSTPKDWAESAAAEEIRLQFLRRYRELRPHATLQRFGVYESLQLALRAMAFMWSQTHGWERIAETFLVLAYERLKSRLPD